MAVNCCVIPSAMLEFVGVTVTYRSVGDVTVRVVEPDTLPSVAVIVVVPAAAGIAKPLEPEELLTAAMAVAEELQVTDAVRSCVALFEYVPTAVNCFAAPSPMLVPAGMIEMDTSAGAGTVRVVEPDMLPSVAVIVVAPADAGVARPLEPEALLTAATAEDDELQVAVAVRSCVVLSE